jgi:hypothetical protein
LKFSNTLRREFEVAFSRNAQPIWFRILKYAVMISFIYFYWRSTLFWIILTGVFILGLLLHFWYRYKTGEWTKSYGGWDFEKNKSKLNF